MEKIIFHEDINMNWYQKVLKACNLADEISKLPLKD